MFVLSPFRSQYQGSDSDVLIVVVRSSPLQSRVEFSRESRGPSNTTKKSREVRRSSEKGGYGAGPVVVGTVMSNDEETNASWAACDLAKVLVGAEELAHDAQGTSIRTFSDQKHL